MIAMKLLKKEVKFMQNSHAVRKGTAFKTMGEKVAKSKVAPKQ